MKKNIIMKNELLPVYEKIAQKMNIDFINGFLDDDFETDYCITRPDLPECSEDEIEICKMDWIHSIKENFLYLVIQELHGDEINSDNSEKYYEKYYDGCFDYLIDKTFEKSYNDNSLEKEKSYNDNSLEWNENSIILKSDVFIELNNSDKFWLYPGYHFEMQFQILFDAYKKFDIDKKYKNMDNIFINLFAFYDYNNAELFVEYCIDSPYGQEYFNYVPTQKEREIIITKLKQWAEEQDLTLDEIMNERIIDKYSNPFFSVNELTQGELEQRKFMLDSIKRQVSRFYDEHGDTYNTVMDVIKEIYLELD